VSAATAVAFWVLAALAVASGVAVFRVDSMARASYALAVSFAAVGLALLLVHLDYVGVVVVLMMVMEMAVMAVYMVMFMGMNPALMPMSMVHGNRTALAAAGTVFVLLGGGALLVPWPVRRGAPPVRDNGAATAALGHALMGPKMLVMMAVSAVMVATIVAGIVIAAPRGRYDRLGDDLRGEPR
jgi:NADH-quinone oxidoreductase subunit J